MTPEPDRIGRDDRPVIAINQRGLILGLDAEGTWIIWNEDDTVWPLHTVWLAHDHLTWLMPLLQQPQDAVIRATSQAEAGSELLSAVLSHALGCWSDYWAGLALEWLEAGYPTTELLDALQALKDSPRQPPLFRGDMTDRGQ
ncbi:hypothetical protein [Pseudosporangium ferrugineum]|uniref:Uncharacterized protein n=1 Tax=Pseudosporangium ferrugineum TaxID=439699 RepID=A0A2T0SA25_9ACTN|nr:hypothetical protein [Pseudosporangium ferrugineum]PRY30268.1 hypothetical protein CLV70_105438 [Pseudosporangium ferrugineum]